MPTLAFIDVVSETRITQPQVARIAGEPPSVQELDSIELSDYGLLEPKSFSCGPSHASTKGETTSITPSELEQSQPSTPNQNESRGVVPSWSWPPMNKFRHLSACLEYFGNGLNDSAPGALIPYIESAYSIGYAIVSLIWVANAAGFILAAFSAEFIDSKFGRARSLMLSEMFVIVAYAVIASPVPFGAVVAAYLMLGFGEALEVALNNVFCSNLANPTVIIGAAHGSYGVGGIVGPLLATAVVSNGIDWHLFYVIPIGIRILCVASTGWSFWNYEKEETTQFSNSLVEIASRQAAAEPAKTNKFNSIASALRNRTTIIGAVFIFAYQGIEVAESGWFISYLIAYRNADAAHVGFVTSGFWAGITLGRFVLTHVARRVGEKKFVFALGFGVVIFQLLAWFVPNVVGDSVAVSIIGLMLGPVYPCAQTVFTRLLPSRIQVFAIGFISSAGSSGGAVVPFLTGLLAQVAGTFVLNPICIGFCLFMLGCWACLPRMVKKTE